MIQSWLELLCAMLPGVVTAVASTESEGKAKFVWPAGSLEDQAVLDAMQMSARQVSTVVISLDDGFIIARPVLDASTIVGLKLKAEPRQRAVVEQLLEWGCSWFELLAKQPTHPTQPLVLPSVLFSIGGESVDEVYQSFVDTLAAATSATRVSLSIETVSELTLVAASFSPNMDRRLNLAALTLASMVESMVFFTSEVSQDESSDGVATELLQKDIGSDSVLNLPFRLSGFGGVVQIQRGSGFDQSDIEQLKGLVSLAAKVLQAEYQRLKPFAAFKSRVKSYFVMRKQSVVFGLAVFVVLFLTLFFVEGDYEVGARATIEGLTQRAIVAPFDGYIEQSDARAGDHVVENTLLASMDDQDLALEQRRLLHESSELDRQYRQALAAGNRSESGIFKAQLAQAEARVALLTNKLSQVHIRAPIAGILITGDLTRSIGAPVSRGDVLFEVAPLNAYRVVVHVSESDIDEIQTQQSGEVTLSSHPDVQIPFSVEGISHVVNSRQDLGVVFETEGRLTQAQDFVRPGMEGYAKISVGKRSWAWILFHDVADWWRLMIWRILP